MADLTEAELRWFKRKKNFLEKLTELRAASRPSSNGDSEVSCSGSKYPKVGPDYFQRFPSHNVRFEALDELKEVSSFVENDGSISEDNESIASVEGSLDRIRINDPKGKRRMDQKWRKILTSVLGPERAAILIGSGRSDSDEEIGTNADNSSDENSETNDADHWTGWKWEALNSDNLRATEKSRVMVYWTGSRYEGQWNKDLNAPHGLGMYIFPHGVTYVGGMHDGRFHGKGVLRYPSGAMVEGVWNHGRIQKRRITFPDGLRYKEKDWDYCSPSDRRFHIERLYGLRAAGRSHLTQQHPTRRLPSGCYDTADGYYNHRTRCVYSFDTRKVLRIPTNKEAEWIMKNCRKAADANVNYEPDIFADVRDEKDLETLIKRTAIPKWKLNGAKDNRKSYFGGNTFSRRSSLIEHRVEADDDSRGESVSLRQKEELTRTNVAAEYEIPFTNVKEYLKLPQEYYSDNESVDRKGMATLMEHLEFWANQCEESENNSIGAEMSNSSVDHEESEKL